MIPLSTITIIINLKLPQINIVSAANYLTIYNFTHYGGYNGLQCDLCGSIGQQANQHPPTSSSSSRH